MEAPGVVLEFLASADRAWDVLTGALALPPPDADAATGAFDIYLIAAAEAERTLLDRRDARAHFDRATAFGLLDARLRGCALDTAVARSVARAALWRAAPGTDVASARAQSSYLARLAAPCAMSEPDGIDRFQAHPERALVSTVPELPIEGEAFDRGAALFYWWLDWSFGSQPASIVRALWALSPTRTPLGSSIWSDHPNAFDVLEASFVNALATGSTFEDVLLDFAVARAFVGSADDGQHLPESRSLGPPGVVRPEWSVAWPDQPRRLASGVGIEPTGAAYVFVDHAGARPGARLRIEAEWEEHAHMLWAVVKIDGSGRQIGALAIPAPDRGTHGQMSVVDLDGTAKILIVVTNAGDPFNAFRPSDAVWEPHGWTVAIAAE